MGAPTLKRTERIKRAESSEEEVRRLVCWGRIEDDDDGVDEVERALQSRTMEESGWVGLGEEGIWIGLGWLVGEID